MPANSCQRLSSPARRSFKGMFRLPRAASEASIARQCASCSACSRGLLVGGESGAPPPPAPPRIPSPTRHVPTRTSPPSRCAKLAYSASAAGLLVAILLVEPLLGLLKLLAGALLARGQTRLDLLFGRRALAHQATRSVKSCCGVSGENVSLIAASRNREPHWLSAAARTAASRAITAIMCLTCGSIGAR